MPCMGKDGVKSPIALKMEMTFIKKDEGKKKKKPTRREELAKGKFSSLAQLTYSNTQYT